MTLLSSSSNLSGCRTVLCPFHSSTKVLGPVVDLIPRPILLLACFVYIIAEYRDFVNNSHSTCSTCRCQKHKCHMSTLWDIHLCMFVILLKTGFVDIAPLCCKPSIYSKILDIKQSRDNVELTKHNIVACA